MLKVRTLQSYWSSARHRSVHLLSLSVVAGLLCSACPNIPDAITQASEEIDKTTAAITSESDAWRSELPKLADRLDQIGASADASIKAELAVTANEVRALEEDTIKTAAMSADEFVANFGAEVRCNTDFFRARVSDTLGALRANLDFWRSHHQDMPPPAHAVCHLNPSTLELRPGQSGTWTIHVPESKIVGVYGYNFRPGATPRVELEDASGKVVRHAVVAADYVTRYQLNLNFAAEDFHQVSPGSRFVLDWPDQADPNTISTDLIQPASLKVLSVTFNPASPRAGVDLERPSAVVANQGGLDSGLFALTWLPAPNTPLQTLQLSSLSPGQQTTVTFPGYVYQAGGTFATYVTLADGTSSYQTTINVAAPAPANYTNFHVDFTTRTDDKDPDSILDVQLIDPRKNNAVVASYHQQGNEAFPDGAVRPKSLSPIDVKLPNVVGLQLRICITPNGNDTWIFDYSLRADAPSEPNRELASATQVRLSQDQSNRCYVTTVTRS